MVVPPATLLMAEVNKLVLIEFTPAQMFELVDRCEDYPLFLPWCGGIELIERTETITAATLHINYHGIKAHFSTENTKRYPQEMKLRLMTARFHGPMRSILRTYRGNCRNCFR